MIVDERAAQLLNSLQLVQLQIDQLEYQLTNAKMEREKLRVQIGGQIVNSLAIKPSSRQRQMLAMVAIGLQNKQIAATVGISERTVKFHISALLRKYQCKNRTELASIAIAIQSPGFEANLCQTTQPPLTDQQSSQVPSQSNTSGQSQSLPAQQ